ARVRDGPGEQQVGEPGVAGKQWSVEVRADRTADTTALEAGGAVVAVSRDDTAERLCAGVENRPPGVVLETRDRAARRLVQSALQEDIADHAGLAGDGLVREETRAFEPGPVASAVAAAEQLVAAAHRQQSRSTCDGVTDRIAARREVGGDHRLLAVLTAADVDEVVRSRRERRFERHGGDA